MPTRFRIQIIMVLAICTSATFTAVGAAPVRAAAGSQFFPATGHTVSGPFLAYWQAHGGLAIFGNPISAAQTERDTSAATSGILR